MIFFFFGRSPNTRAEACEGHRAPHLVIYAVPTNGVCMDNFGLDF